MGMKSRKDMISITREPSRVEQEEIEKLSEKVDFSSILVERKKR